MKGATLVWKNMAKAKKGLDKIEKKRVKTAQTAAKVEGFRLMKKLKPEVRAGRPGGRRLKPLSKIARRTKTGRLKKNINPLASAAKLVRYTVKRGRQFNVSVGFVSNRVTQSWKRLLMGHQRGSTSGLYSRSRTNLGIHFARIGGKLKKKGDPDARFFFLTKKAGAVKGGVKGKLPARPIIDPFWRANRAEAQRNIVKNFERKMAGERI